jgi:hypothetical protein
MGAYRDFEWRTIPNFPDYEIREDGAIRRLTGAKTRTAGHVLKFNMASRYPRVKLSLGGMKYSIFVHRLVCEAFNGPAPFEGALCRHLDDNPTNNHFSNLAWGTSLDNHNDRRRNGRSFDGERNHKAKLTWPAVYAIRASYTGKFGQISELAKLHGVGHTTMMEVVHGQSWQKE